MERNRFVGEIADEVFISYAEPRGKMEGLCWEWIEKGKTVMTFQRAYNEQFLELGAVPLKEGRRTDA